jgi:hypothetical protein
MPATAVPSGVLIDEDHRGKLALFILAGQSNMSGVGPIPADAPGASTQIYLFGNDYRWHIAEEPVDRANNQVDGVSLDSGAGYSPAMSFGTELLASDPDLVVGLIPCAKGSSSISQWRRDLSDNSLYGSCIKRVRAASTMGEVAGILFFQGESEVADPNRFPELDPQPDQWGALFTRLVGDFRADLNEPLLPVIFAQLGSHGMPQAIPAWELVKAQQAAVEIPRVAMIKTDDLSLQDELHFSAESYTIIGARFAEAYRQLLDETMP